MGKIAERIEECFVEMLRSELAEAGFNSMADYNNDKVIMTYFTKCMSFLIPIKYKIHVHSDFTCPIEYQDGYRQLIDKMSNGENINAHLSRTTKSTEKHDLMLYEWGIYHFHLGSIIEDDGYIQRTKDVLYAYIKENDIYIIGIYEHGKWSDKELIEIIHKYYPESIADSKMENVVIETHFTTDDRKQLRKAKINMAVQLDDGTCYIGPGWGINGAGTSAWSSLRTLEKHREFRVFEQSLIEYDPNAENRRWIIVRVEDKIYLANDADVAYLLYQWPTLKMRIGIRS